ncbi:hypothetical protein ACFOZ0_08015 [Streptomyces yaanensis]|uniref:Integral membrane protein n=1 Tax=Streptomyces yaanensis TaxID=1142239 RepID=A0ABV7S872_9ACTN|nr:hypothetical protein [Streptomyces sp. CGMCC 4.7035]WNC02722.1 hypothetical protein Q2K21_34280 [Streptomyces sp. CGMCC 4.7035]
MSNQPYEGYDPTGYDPYQQQGYPQQPPQAQSQPPQQQGWYDPNAAYQQPQQWEGQAYGTAQPLPPEGQVYEPHGYAAPGVDGLAHPSRLGVPPGPQGTGGGTTAQGGSGEGWTTAQGGGGNGWAVAQGGGGTQTATAPEPPVDLSTLPANQRARLEGRSPIIEPGLQPAALTAVLGALLAGAAALGTYALVVPLVLLQAVTAAGWFRLNGMWPARQGIALAFLGAVTADVALLVAGREHAPAAILGTLGVWVLLSLVLQLRSHADPDTRMHGLMATVASAALSIIAAGHLAAPQEAVTVGAVAVAAATLARALPLPTAASVVVALLAAAGAGIAMGGATGLGTSGAFLGLGAGACALIGHRVASYDYPSRFVHFTAGVALPLTAAAPVVYLLGRALV